MAEKILLVDDDKEFRAEFKEYLDGYDIVEAGDGEQVLNLLKKPNEIVLVILDVKMPGLKGTLVLKKIKELNPNLHTIILTGCGTKDTAIEALRGRADDYMEKPLDLDKLRSLIYEMMEKTHTNGNSDMNGLNGKIQKAKRFIERNCFQKIVLKDAANSIYISPKYLSRIFSQGMGISFNEYRLKTKMDKAKEFLAKKNYSISQLSAKLGYQNVESFITQFRKRFKCTPVEYRRKHGRKK